MKNLLARLALKFIDLQCRRECIFNVTFDLTNIWKVNENLRLDFNSDRRVLNFLVFAYGIKVAVLMWWLYGLVLTYKRYTLNYYLHRQGAKVSQIAENCFCYLFCIILHLHSFEQYSARFVSPVQRYSLLFVFSICLLSVCSQPVILLCPFHFTTLWFHLQSIRGPSGKYPAILNISRTGRVALM